MVVPADLLDPVVPDLEHPAQPVAGPDPVPCPDGLDGAFPVSRADQRAFRSAPVTAGAQALGLRLGVGTEQLRDRPVGPLDDRAAGRGDHARAGAVGTEPGRAGEARGGRVPQGRGDDAHPVGDRPWETRRSADVLVHVARARVRLPCATPGEQQPPVPAALRRDLVGEWGPPGLRERARVQQQPVGRQAPSSRAITHGGEYAPPDRRRAPDRGRLRGPRMGGGAGPYSTGFSSSPRVRRATRAASRRSWRWRWVRPRRR